MTNSLKKLSLHQGLRRGNYRPMLASFGLIASLATSATSWASAGGSPSIALATKPLTRVAGTLVKPNLMFVFDTSASMANDRANDTLNDGGQCKEGTKDAWGFSVTSLTRGDTTDSANPKINAASKPNTTLTITAPSIWGGGFPAGRQVYLTVPGNPSFSGRYEIKKFNYTPGSSGSCDPSSIVMDNPLTIYDPVGRGERPYSAAYPPYNPGNPFSDPPVAPTLAGPPRNGCALGPKPSNSGVTGNSSNGYYGENKGGGFVVDASGITSTPSSDCYWFDPYDQAANTVQTSCTMIGAVDASGDYSMEIDVANHGTLGLFSADQIKDARILEKYDTSLCYGGEPPLAASKVQSLFYDPTVSYQPPPSPIKVGLGLKAPLAEDLYRLNSPGTAHNLLPSMDKIKTNNWTAVKWNGLQINAADVQTSAAYSMNTWTDMVWCDTPDRPTRKDAANPFSGTFTSDKDWFDSNRCKRNSMTNNPNATSPNYPYLYPARTDGGYTPYSNTFIVNQSLAHQVGQSKFGKNPVFDTYPTPTSSDNQNAYYVFGEYDRNSSPFYYNIKPIEYCDSARLNNCIISATPTASYTYPAYVRYCKQATSHPDQFSTSSNTNYSPDASNCQGIYTGNGTSDYRIARYGLFQRVDINSASAPFVKGVNRTDCQFSTCSYAEEMTNYANWYAYYRTRLQLMQSAIGRTFNDLDLINTVHDESEDYRIGFITVENYSALGNYLPIKDFLAGTNGQKELFFRSIYSRTPSGGTSLREVLGTVGRIFSGQKPVAGYTAVTDDPMQYACQQNFTLLTTDGYWNGVTGLKVLGTSSVGNQDGGTTLPPKAEGITSPDTLADVAKFYYDTDLRNNINYSNCTGQLGSDVCDDGNIDTAKSTQRMTTFTLGLGVDGALSYTADYKTPTGDFVGLSNGSIKWPTPGPDNGDSYFTPQERATVDDLWHAAVNGNGTYFSARNPQDVISGIRSTLISLADLAGTSSTTALSSVTPVAGDNYAFSARFRTGNWTGNLFARTIDDHANLSSSLLWCVEPETSPACSPDATTGLFTKVQATADTRTIYSNNGGNLVPFKYSNLTASQDNYFKSSYIKTRLSQWGSYSSGQKAAAGGDSLVNYLRGQKGYDTRITNTVSNNRLYRERTAVLGDIVESDPTYVGKSYYQYLDAGYSTPSGSAYIDVLASQTRSVYVGANDGMLHAFNAATGEERWAFVPSAVMPNMWNLADEDYRNQHTNFVNGEITVAHIYAEGAWKTILISGLGQGGRGYFALDITNPTTPKLLWEFDASTESDLGYSFGKPLVSKRARDGKWVAMLSSGYNNTNDGKGRLFVLDAYSGADLSSGGISTGVGSSGTPSGLAQISAFVSDPNKNNQAQYVYGGDLLGNLWRFDLNTNSVFKLTTLVDGSGNAQPITVAPTLTTVNGKRVVFVGTGKYIEPKDLLPANYNPQSLYAIKDDNAATTITGLRAQMVEQSLTGDSGTRTGSSNAVNWATSLGWYVDLPGSATTGELQNIKASIISGVLFVPTIVPPTGTCDTSGKGWTNTFNFSTGGAVDPSSSNVVSTQSSVPIAGLYFTFPSAPSTPDAGSGASKGSSISIGTETVTGKDPNPIDVELIGVSAPFAGSRAIWRELVE